MSQTKDIKSIRDTLLRKVSQRDVRIFAVCLVLASFFWYERTSTEQSDATLHVDFEIENLPAGTVFTSAIPTSLEVTLYDSNEKLQTYKGKSDRLRLTVDFRRYSDIMGNFQISGAELQSLLLNHLESTTQVTAIQPASISATFTETDGRRVPVRLHTQLTVRDNYKDFPPELLTDSVLVHAPHFILDTLRCIDTHLLRADNLDDTLRATVALNLHLGIKATPDSVRVVIPVMQYVSKTFDNVIIQVKDLPAGKRLILFPRQVSLKCLANFGHYQQFSADDFIVSVSYDSLRNCPWRATLPLQVYTPLSSYEVSDIRLSADEVEFTLEEQ